MDDDLVARGRVLRLETRGRTTGRPARAVVGFATRPDGSLVISAGSTSADWARNLLRDPACRVTVGDATFAAVAVELDAGEHVEAVRDLILKYGTPAEGLGSGPSFAVRPMSG